MKQSDGVNERKKEHQPFNHNFVGLIESKTRLSDTNTGRWGLYPGYPAPAYVPAPSVAAPNYDSSGYGLNTPYVHDGYGLYTAANPGYVGPVVLGRRRRK